MRKILFIHPNLNPLHQDGAYTRLKMFSNSLAEQDFIVSIIVLVPISEWFQVVLNLRKLDNRFTWYVLPSFSFYTNQLLGSINRFYAAIFISLIVRLKKFRLIQCELSTTLILTRFCSKSIKYISDFHADLYPELEFYGEKQWKIELAKKEARYSLKNSQHVLSVSRNLNDHLQQNYQIQFNVSVQPCLPDLGNFNSSFDERESKRTKLGLNGKILLGYLGGLQDYQCIEQTIELFHRIKETGLDVFLCIYTCDELSGIQEVLNDKGLDSSSFMIKCLSRSEVSIYTSILDVGFLLRENKTINIVSSPTKGLEYLAAGNGLISTAYAGNIPDIISESACGLILDDLDFSKRNLDLVRKFIVSHMATREQSFNEARKLVQHSYSWDSHFESLKHIYSY